MIETVFHMKILLKMCLYEIKRKRSTYKTATLTSHLAGNSSVILPKLENLVEAVYFLQ